MYRYCIQCVYILYSLFVICHRYSLTTSTLDCTFINRLITYSYIYVYYCVWRDILYIRFNSLLSKKKKSPTKAIFAGYLIRPSGQHDGIHLNVAERISGAYLSKTRSSFARAFHRKRTHCSYPSALSFCGMDARVV